jgi:transposase, IS5 family
VDEESGRRPGRATPANVHDRRLGESLIQRDEQRFFADRGYDSQALHAGWSTGIAREVNPRYPLEPWQRLHNARGQRALSRRAAFATMKRWYGVGRVRYLGRARNACHLQLVAMAMNMKRALVLMRP